MTDTASEGESDGVELLVCATCRHPDAPDDEPRAGARLAGALAGAELPEGVRLRTVECLSNCKRGCTAALRGPGRWAYVYGDLDPETAPAVLAEGAALYRDAPDGLIPWRARPEHFKRHCIARLPPIGAPE